ncbi:response regulator [Mucilaginibacter limnophilus]|uniref:Response regulator n=2 Tax=Mucilaginibacter limnophilus TaxID=1932778 RepID=A0A3S2X0U6_9SPHI|nr:response regulator [Mucilaginibacter limnophilus]
MCALTMIDDNPLDHMIVRRICERDGAFDDVLFIQDARQVLKAFRDNGEAIPRHPDIILLDLNMPLLSGWEFLEHFNEIYPKLSKPVDVYVLSSSVDEADREMALMYPFVKDFFIKPMTSSVMRNLRSRYAA